MVKLYQFAKEAIESDTISVRLLEPQQALDELLDAAESDTSEDAWHFPTLVAQGRIRFAPSGRILAVEWDRQTMIAE